MPTRSLKEFIQRLGLEANKSVFFLNTEGKYRNAPVFSREISDKLQIIKPDAFFAFNKQPFILFFDLIDNDHQRENQIHKQVWSLDYVPVIFIIKEDDIQVFNAFHYIRSKNRLERIALAPDEIEDRFSFWNLQSGQTWKWLQAEKFRDSLFKKRVNQKLFDNIKQARAQLQVHGLSLPKANIIILRLIFIRYLIDRGVGIRKDFIAGETIDDRRASLSRLIFDSSKLNEFFEYLNARFNGALFKDVSFTLTKRQASFLSVIFDIRKTDEPPTLFDQTFYFDVFDFSIIPVEVISGIYESIIDDATRNKHSAIYTPPFLVEFILSSTVDKHLIHKRSGECKILDPACGSGIFLVQSYRRIVDDELKRSGQATIESSRLREIAEKNLFGIDLNDQALLVASFSIYIAILDYKQPKEINTFIFPELRGKNLFDANFFDETHYFNEQFKSIEFDFILGNPPWRNGKSDLVHVEYLKKHSLLSIISDFQLAQSFVLRSRDFITSNTKCALIVTSKSFYNIHAQPFKKKFLSEYYLDRFLDMSPVRRYIFKDAINPGCIIFYRHAFGKDTSTNVTRHESLKPNIFLKYFSLMVLQKHDRKQIKQGLFIKNPWMFKTALYGGTLDYSFIRRLQENETIKDLLIGHKSEWQDLHFGDGIKKLTEAARSKSTKKEHARFSAIRDIPIIETDDITELYTPVRPTNLPRPEDLFVKSGNNLQLYQGERILIKARPRNESSIVVSYVDSDSVFREKTLGISSNTKTTALKILYAYFISRLYSYYQFVTSSSWGVYYPEVLQDEYLSFPFRELTEEENNMLLRNAEEIIKSAKQHHQEILKPEMPGIQGALAEIDRLINNGYEVNETEKDLIDYALKVSRREFQSDNTLVRKVNLDTTLLMDYSEVFFNEFTGLYKGEYLYAQIYPLNHFIAINFQFQPVKPETDSRVKVVTYISDEQQVLTALSEKLSIWNITDSKNEKNNIYIQKDIKGFEKNSFYIIKPNEYKCWHRAIAWYDVAEIKDLIEKAEMEMFSEMT